MISAIEWILGRAPRPECCDASVFVSIVSAIFKRSRDDQNDIRDLLTYLLLKRNPRTNEPILLQYRNAEEEEPPENVKVLQEVVSRMFERYITGNGKAVIFPTIQYLHAIGSNRSANWVNGEEISLLLMSMWLFSKTLVCNDIYIKYACLKLNRLHLTTETSSLEHEFTADRLGYLNVMINESERLCMTDLPTEMIASELSYLGGFISLIRSVRMGISEEVRDVLRDEVARLQSETNLQLGVNNDNSRH